MTVKMGTSNRGVTSYQNISNGKSARTMEHATNSSRPRSAFHGKRRDQITGEGDGAFKPHTSSRDQSNNNVRSRVSSSKRRPANFPAGRPNMGFSSARSEVDPRGRLNTDRSGISCKNQGKVADRYSVVRPSSAIAAGSACSLPQRRELAKPRPHSSIIARSCLSSSITPSHPQLRRTLDDLPMQHTQEDALTMLERKRAEMAAQHRVLRQEGGEIKMVSNFGRRMFDCAVNNRGKCPLPPPSPSEAAALFFRAPRPSWSPHVTEENRLKPRAQSLVAEQAPAIESLKSSRQRPDSEPPIRWRDGREFNHLRHHRQMYPHINKLVQRYNEDMRVVCPQTLDVSERRRNSKDFSVASEFLLVPLRQDEEAEINPEVLGHTDTTAPLEVVGDLLLQKRTKMEDQLSTESTRLSHKSFAAVDDTAGSERARSEEEPSPPWRCWVDDATVSTVHSRAPSIATADDAAPEEDGVARQTLSTMKNSDASGAPRPSTDSKTQQQQPGEVPVKSSIPPQPAPPAQKDKKGRKKKEEALPEPPPPPPPPVEEPEIVVEEVVEEEPEPEPEPVPPSYICPSSEDKSLNVEIRRWIHKSPFKNAAKTTPIF